MTESPSTLAIAFAAFVVGGLVKGVIGMGLPTTAVGVMSLILPPGKAAALLAVPALVTNVWQYVTGPNRMAVLRRFALMLIGVCAGILAGAGRLSGDAAGEAVVALGVCLILYGLIGLSGLRLVVPPRMERWLSPPIGFVTGLVTAATGIFVIPAVPYIQALDLERDDLIQALGLSFSVSTIVLSITLMHDGILQSSVAVASAVALVPALLGMVLGGWLRRLISPPTFRICFFAGMVVLGAHLASRAWL
jgi:uncharacterized membrane protein YfcA